jgi:hypothetical protein
MATLGLLWALCVMVCLEISAVFEGCSRGYLQPPPASLVPHGYKRLTVFGKRKACDGCKGESNDADAEAAARQT